MRMFLLGIVCTLVVLAGLAVAAVVGGWIPANADGPYLPLEHLAARTALDATIRAQMPQGQPPIAPTVQNLIAGVNLYAQNCIVCHGASDGAASNPAKGMYQRPPQLAKDGVEDDPPGETYWKIEHGIRWTAMPSFDKTLSETQMWQLALFLKNMDKLPPAAAAAWQSLKMPAPTPVALR